MVTQSIIKSYPYVQFADDENIVSLFSAYNTYSQEYLDWIIETPLAIYTNTNISGDLLDWVANGIYGVYRVPITSSQSKTIGPINTYGPNEIPINEADESISSSVTTMTDDTFRRLITWNFYKGDGFQFTIPWFKRRIARFLHGINGFEDTHDISVVLSESLAMSVSITTTNETKALAQQLEALIGGWIPNLPSGYTIDITVT